MKRGLFVIGLLFIFVIIGSFEVSAGEDECNYNTTAGNENKPNCIPSNEKWSDYSTTCDCCGSTDGSHTGKMLDSIQGTYASLEGKCIDYGTSEYNYCVERTFFPTLGANVYPYIDYDSNSETGWCSTWGRCLRGANADGGPPSTYIGGNFLIPNACGGDNTFCEIRTGECKTGSEPPDLCTGCEGGLDCVNNFLYNACQAYPVSRLDGYVSPTCNWYGCCGQQRSNGGFYDPEGLPDTGSLGLILGPLCGDSICSSDECIGYTTLADYSDPDSAIQKINSGFCSSGTCNPNCGPRERECNATFMCKYSTDPVLGNPVLCGGLNNLKCHQRNADQMFVWDIESTFVETNCTDLVDNDCDGTPDNGPLCGTGGGGCVDIDGDYYNTTTSAECGPIAHIDCDDNDASVNFAALETDSIPITCRDGKDNDCDNKKDWDTQVWDGVWPTGEEDGIIGDDGCPVGINDIYTNPSFTENSLMMFACIMSSGYDGINSFQAYIEEDPCTYIHQTGSYILFQCNTGPAATKTLNCTVNSSKSYRNTGDVTTTIVVEPAPQGILGDNCGDYTIKTDCEANLNHFWEDYLDPNDPDDWEEYNNDPTCLWGQNQSGCQWDAVAGEGCTSKTVGTLHPNTNTTLCGPIPAFVCNYLPGDKEECADDQEFFKINYARTPTSPAVCILPERILACPAQIALPFFGFYQAIFVMLGIALIYGVLGLKRKEN